MRCGPSSSGSSPRPGMERSPSGLSCWDVPRRGGSDVSVQQLSQSFGVISIILKTNSPKFLAMAADPLG